MPTQKKAPKSTPRKASFWRRHRWLWLVAMLFIFLALGIIIAGIFQLTKDKKESAFQKEIAPFYNTSNLELDGQMGEVVRQEPLGVNVPNGKGIRVLYRTEKPDGTPTFSSGMVFIPSTPAASERPVVAWAHGSLGFGDQCAPSRLEDPLANLDWLSGMLQKGWVVTATDYAGFGTPGTQGYLVGEAEAHDVLNSVRAARNITDAEAASRFAILGHSQGGHSALFSAQAASAYAPELELVGTVAAAPAAELVSILDQSENTPIDWVIGPDIMASWPAFNNKLSVDSVLSSTGKRTYESLANKCIGKAVVAGLIRTDLKQQFFKLNPIDQPEWRAETDLQNAPILKPSQPLMVVESTADTVIPPKTTENYIRRSCQAGLPLSTIWMNKVGHPDVAQVAGPQITAWIYDQFAGKPWASSCGASQPDL